jgi:hypothetical protein
MFVSSCSYFFKVKTLLFASFFSRSSGFLLSVSLDFTTTAVVFILLLVVRGIEVRHLSEGLPVVN